MLSGPWNNRKVRVSKAEGGRKDHPPQVVCQKKGKPEGTGNMSAVKGKGIRKEMTGPRAPTQPAQREPGRVCCSAMAGEKLGGREGRGTASTSAVPTEDIAKGRAKKGGREKKKPHLLRRGKKRKKRREVKMGEKETAKWMMNGERREGKLCSNEKKVAVQNRRRRSCLPYRSPEGEEKERHTRTFRRGGESGASPIQS